MPDLLLLMERDYVWEQTASFDLNAKINGTTCHQISTVTHSHFHSPYFTNNHPLILTHSYKIQPLLTVTKRTQSRTELHESFAF